MSPYWLLALAGLSLGRGLAAVAWYDFNAVMASKFGAEVLDKTKHLRAEPVSEAIPKALARRQHTKSRDDAATPRKG
ncbi:hypothetical protein ACQPZX_07145 [Actinoplanes sp. CA-142083]|uniref:hypothetical protein n=1 Tax=Actinoplanes sp. CA-142083 TaxID=3239903 RepID=UPI003D8A1353